MAVVKERLKKSASCSEISFLSIFKTLLGILVWSSRFIDIKRGENNFDFFFVSWWKIISLNQMTLNLKKEAGTYFQSDFWKCGFRYFETQSEYYKQVSKPLPYWLSPQWLCGNSCNWAHDVRLHIAWKTKRRVLNELSEEHNVSGKS